MDARRALTTMFATAAVVPVLVLGAPTAQADEPPPFDVPVEVLPYIDLPSELNGSATGLAVGVENAILAFNAGNAAAVNGLFGVLGNVLCAFAAGSSNPCSTQ